MEITISESAKQVLTGKGGTAAIDFINPTA